MDPALMHTHTHTHTDSTVGIEGEQGPTMDCELETSTEEGGSVVITLVRDGSLEYEEGVVCYTEDDSAKANADYVPRPINRTGSEVVFAVNESKAECVVRIEEDAILEPRERFMVRLAPHSEHGFVNTDPYADSMCVYINYDNNDGKGVSGRAGLPFPAAWYAQILRGHMPLDWCVCVHLLLIPFALCPN